MAEAKDELLNINRQSLYINDGPTSLFGWYHTGANAPAKDCAIVLCNPIGYEYIHSHRTMRHLADNLAANGIPTLRFDYHGTGDSPGDDTDADRLACWLQNIKAAITQAKALSGRSKICLLGLRMGATLAALVASEVEVDYLALWQPCVNGRHYVREMQALALLADGAKGLPDEANASSEIESAGFILSGETAEQLKKINLLKLQYKVECQALIIGCNDLAKDVALLDKLCADNIDANYVVLPGYAEMMAEPQFTIVPTVAIKHITDWLANKLSNGEKEKRYEAGLVGRASAPAVGAADLKLSGPATPGGHLARPTYTALHSPGYSDAYTLPIAPPAPPHLGAPDITFIYSGDGIETRLHERACHFGRDGSLFGIFSYAAKAITDKPAIVLLNAGAAHHVGPNRLYVTLARNLSALGYTCLRFDLEGLGDSVTPDAALENHPYPATATRDAEAAIRYLTEEYGCAKFIVMGLCSGAHTAFHAGIALPDFDIVESILINPLTFHWEAGMSLETTQATQHFQDVAYYKQSARNIKSWRKLLTGEAHLSYAIGVVLAQLRVSIRAQRDALRERFKKQDSTPLAADLRKYFAAQRRLSLFIAADDPGYDILMAGAKRAAQQGIKAKKINVQFIPDADHTFSRAAARREFTAMLGDHIKAQHS